VSTLVLSDMHLGSRLRHDVLAQPEPLDRLLQALEGIERLVLLGDIVELLEKPAEHAMNVAEPILRRIGKTMGVGREVIFVPGNHDRALVAGWIRRLGANLAPDSRVPLDATPELARIASWLAPSRVQVRYPGVWVAPGVWATHGHYLDRHLLPEAAFGVTRGLLGRVPRPGARPIDYERAGGPSLTRVEALVIKALPRPLAALAEDVAELIRASTMPLGPRRLLRPGMARLTASVLGAQMRFASLPALSHVVRRLGVDADWVLFGHVHRLGPLPDDLQTRWRGPQGHLRLVNTGSWVYEPLLVHNATPPHPYWPGGAVILDRDRAPRAIGLLDTVPASALH
jgi:UDP-2,3-diacylglucosamine pyrophosphatase LpxH